MQKTFDRLGAIDAYLNLLHERRRSSQKISTSAYATTSIHEILNDCEILSDQDTDTITSDGDRSVAEDDMQGMNNDHHDGPLDGHYDHHGGMMANSEHSIGSGAPQELPSVAKMASMETAMTPMEHAPSNGLSRQIPSNGPLKKSTASSKVLEHAPSNVPFGHILSNGLSRSRQSSKDMLKPIPSNGLSRSRQSSKALGHLGSVDSSFSGGLSRHIPSNDLSRSRQSSKDMLKPIPSNGLLRSTTQRSGARHSSSDILEYTQSSESIKFGDEDIAENGLDGPLDESQTNGGVTENLLHHHDPSILTHYGPSIETHSGHLRTILASFKNRIGQCYGECSNVTLETCKGSLQDCMQKHGTEVPSIQDCKEMARGALSWCRVNIMDISRTARTVLADSGLADAIMGIPDAIMSIHPSLRTHHSSIPSSLRLDRVRVSTIEYGLLRDKVIQQSLGMLTDDGLIRQDKLEKALRALRKWRQDGGGPVMDVQSFYQLFVDDGMNAHNDGSGGRMDAQNDHNGFPDAHAAEEDDEHAHLDVHNGQYGMHAETHGDANGHAIESTGNQTAALMTIHTSPFSRAQRDHHLPIFASTITATCAMAATQWSYRPPRRSIISDLVQEGICGASLEGQLHTSGWTP